MMRMYLLPIVIFSISCVAQSPSESVGTNKVDSVFSYYFKLVELEISKSPITDENIQYYIEMKNEVDTMYMLRDLPEAYKFLTDITGIKMPFSDKSEDMIMTEEISKQWINWYIDNKEFLIWSEKRNKPVLRKKGSNK